MNKTKCLKSSIIGEGDKNNLNVIFNNPKFKEIHIETYLEDPYVFLLRAKEKNVISRNDSGRILISKSDKMKTRITTIPLDEISDCKIKQYADNEFEIKFSIRNVKHKIFVEV